MNQTVIDIHAHILPGIDDGAKNWEEAGRMLDIAIASGSRTIVATPHYSRHQDPEKIRKLVCSLEQEARKRCPQFEVACGNEIMYFDSIIEALNNGTALTLADSRYVLVEFQPDVPYQKLYQGIRKILLGGYYPVIAHVERYGVLRQDEKYKELMDTGCLMQMNYSSLKGKLFDQNVRWCRRQVLQNNIHLMGTDMHHDVRRSPMIEDNLKWLALHMQPDEFSRVTYDAGMRIIQSGKSGNVALA